MCVESKKVEYCEHYGNGGCGVKLLHCTAVYVSGHGTAAGDDYARLSVVRQSVGKSFKLKVSGIVITPSTVSARVDLTGDDPHGSIFTFQFINYFVPVIVHNCSSH